MGYTVFQLDRFQNRDQKNNSQVLAQRAYQPFFECLRGGLEVFLYCFDTPEQHICAENSEKAENTGADAQKCRGSQMQYPGQISDFAGELPALVKVCRTDRGNADINDAGAGEGRLLDASVCCQNKTDG